MNADADHLTRLLVGESRRFTVVALLIAGVLLLVASTVEYLALSRVVEGSETNVWFDIRQTYRLAPVWGRGLMPITWVYGYVLVVGLAAIPAYNNAGYLTSVLLAMSPNVGVALWSIHGFDEYVTLTPMLVFDRVLPEGLLVATLGFLLGLGFRKVRRTKTASRPPKADAPER